MREEMRRMRHGVPKRVPAGDQLFALAGLLDVQWLRSGAYGRRSNKKSDYGAHWDSAGRHNGRDIRPGAPGLAGFAGCPRSRWFCETWGTLESHTLISGTPTHPER